MKNRLLLTLLSCLVLLTAAAPAQVTTEKGSASDQTNIKLAKMDLLIKLVPLAITKDQFPDLLLGIEKARQVQRETLKAEDDDLAALDPVVTSVIDNAVQKGVYPPKDVQQKVADQLQTMRTRRIMNHAKMIKLVTDQIKAKLNDGQLKAMAGSFSEKFINPSAKPGDLTQDVKISFFVDQVFLDPLAYDLLVEMAKHAS